MRRKEKQFRQDLISNFRYNAPEHFCSGIIFREKYMKIVFLDAKTLGQDIDIQCFSKLGDMIVYDNTEDKDVTERIRGAQVVLTNKCNIDGSAMAASPELKYIGLAATGYNNIDVEYAGKNGIAVTNVKGYSTDTVAQHTFALLLSLMENIKYYDSYIKEYQYAKSDVFTSIERPFMELSGKIWGIIGLGEIGRKVADIASAFGCKVIYYSTTGNNNNPNYERAEFDKLLTDSDIISVHAPLNENTRAMMNYDAFSKMKRSAYFINVGRGAIVVEKDLRRALDEGCIAGAGLDVFEKEPVEAQCELLKVKNPDRLIMTPHIAWAATEARIRLVEEMYRNIEAFYKGERRNRVD